MRATVLVLSFTAFLFSLDASARGTMGCRHFVSEVLGGTFTDVRLVKILISTNLDVIDVIRAQDDKDGRDEAVAEYIAESNKTLQTILRRLETSQRTLTNIRDHECPKRVRSSG